jgi:uncharacterized protein
VPNDPQRSSTFQPPYYLLASQPGASSDVPQFQLTTPMIVNSKNNLAAYISVNSDPTQDYGKLTVLRVPSTAVTKGPEQVANILNTNTTISQNLSLLEGAGSTVLKGNLLTLPVGDSFLYVEPLYVQGTTGGGTYPVLQRVLVVYGDGGTQPGHNRVGFEETLGQALTDLQPGHTTGERLPAGSLGGGGGNNNPTTPTATSTPTAGSGSSTPGSAIGSKVTVQQLESAQNEVTTAIASGDQTKIEAAIAHRNQVLDAYLKAQASTLPTARSTPAPRTATPSK